MSPRQREQQWARWGSMTRSIELFAVVTMAKILICMAGSVIGLRFREETRDIPALFLAAIVVPLMFDLVVMAALRWHRDRLIRGAF